MGLEYFSQPENAFLFLLATAWTLPWKGYALWKSARRKEKWWFIALLIVNTLGLLEILYIFVFSRKPKKSEKDDHGQDSKDGGGMEKGIDA